MKILHLTAGAMFGGVESLALLLARAKDFGADIESHYALCFEGELSRRLTQLSAPCRCVGEVRWSRPWTILKARSALRKWILEESFDAFICHSSWPHAIFGAALNRLRPDVPLFFWIHDTPSGTHWLEKLSRRTPPTSVIAGSDYIGSQAHRIFPNTPVKVVHTPVEDRHIVDGLRPETRNRIRASLDTPLAAQILVLVGRMDPLKGHMNLLESLGRLKADPTFQSAAPWNLWIVGAPQRDSEKDYYKKLKLKTEELTLNSHVRFLGFRNDISEILCAADWYSQPNIEPEAFGITFIEALYAGLPVITTRMGGGQEIVGEECGMLVPPGDPASLDEALKRALGPGSLGLREKLSASARSRAKFLCDPIQQFKKLESILRGSTTS